MKVAVVCAAVGAVLLASQAPAQDSTLKAPKVDPKEKTVSFAARVGKLDTYKELKGVVEYILVMPGGKEYESLLIGAVDPIKLYEGLKKIGVEPGKSAEDDGNGNFLPAKGGKLRAWVEWKADGKKRREPLETFVLDTKTGKPMAPVDWIFIGSRSGFDPDTEKEILQVVLMKNLVALHQSDATVLLQNPVISKSGHRYKANKKALPKTGTPVTVIFKAAK